MGTQHRHERLTLLDRCPRLPRRPRLSEGPRQVVWPPPGERILSRHGLVGEHAAVAFLRDRCQRRLRSKSRQHHQLHLRPYRNASRVGARVSLAGHRRPRVALHQFYSSQRQDLPLHFGVLLGRRAAHDGESDGAFRPGQRRRRHHCGRHPRRHPRGEQRLQSLQRVVGRPHRYHGRLPLRGSEHGSRQHGREARADFLRQPHDRIRLRHAHPRHARLGQLFHQREDQFRHRPRHLRPASPGRQRREPRCRPQVRPLGTPHLRQRKLLRFPSAEFYRRPRRVAERH